MYINTHILTHTTYIFTVYGMYNDYTNDVGIYGNHFWFEFNESYTKCSWISTK